MAARFMWYELQTSDARGGGAVLHRRRRLEDREDGRGPADLHHLQHRPRRGRRHADPRSGRRGRGSLCGRATSASMTSTPTPRACRAPAARVHIPPTRHPRRRPLRHGDRPARGGVHPVQGQPARRPADRRRRRAGLRRLARAARPATRRPGSPSTPACSAGRRWTPSRWDRPAPTRSSAEAGDQAEGGIMASPPTPSAPLWSHYFSVDSDRRRRRARQGRGREHHQRPPRRPRRRLDRPGLGPARRAVLAGGAAGVAPNTSPRGRGRGPPAKPSGRVRGYGLADYANPRRGRPQRRNGFA